uniref:Uncharacterized protein n=1 Tax=uncultured marine group II/III euryarchaeote KM3_195_B08 TaxID=1457970 RepID=A0A075GRX5_9EURY|nr:hypothetical protein [uncultured marine group II/III euryarchaeote KM3_195_B08]
MLVLTSSLVFSFEIPKEVTELGEEALKNTKNTLTSTIKDPFEGKTFSQIKSECEDQNKTKVSEMKKVCEGIDTGEILDMNGVKLKYYSSFAGNTVDNAENKVENLLEDPIIMLLIGVAIMLGSFIVLKEIGKIALNMGETIMFMLSTLSLAVVVFLLILKNIGFTIGFEELVDPTIYFTSIVLIISMGVYLLIKVFPR